MKLPSLFSRLIAMLALLVAMMSVAPAVFAQNGAAPAQSGQTVSASPAVGPGVVAEQRDKLDRYGATADQYQTQMRANAHNDSALVDVRGGLEELSRDLIASGVAFRPRLNTINTRLDEIGPPRGENEPPEPPALTAERQTLIDEKAEINALIGRAESLSLRVNGMIEEINQTRRDLFTNTLSRRYDISSALNGEVLGDLAAETRRLSAAVSSWMRFVLNFKLQAVLLATFYALVAAGILMIGGRRLFGNLFDADPAIENPSYLSRLSVAFWSTLLPSAALGVFLAGTYFFYNYYGVLRYDIAQLMVTLFNVIAIVFFVYRLARAVFAPRLPNWRLLPMQTGAARALFWVSLLAAIVTGADFFASKINEVMQSPLSLTVAKSLLATVIVGLLVIVFGLVRPYVNEDGTSRGWNSYFKALILLLGAGTILAAFLGYIGLARFISQQVVITGAILSTMYIGYLSAGAISEIGGFMNTSFGRRLDRKYHFDETTEDQIGLLLSVVINVLVLAVGIPLILLQWGFQWGDIRLWTYNIANEIRIGSISISLIGILTGFLLFLLGYLGTRGFQRWLDGKVMARGKVDAGVRNSIKTAVGYAGIALAALVGISAAGIDLSNLALVAGALSLGIGFGLQNIVNNFVSGLILLAERPFKVGDWIVAGGISGTVKKISVRATEIETFQRQSVILPNSELINAAVGNWTHRNRLGRVDIAVGVAYQSDPRQVQQILLEIIRAQPQAMKNPEPMVVFIGFGASSLDFEVRAFLSDVTTQVGFMNEVRFQIFERFREEGIEIPFPQQDVYIKEMPKVAVEQALPPAPAEAAKPAKRSTPQVRRKAAPE
ncbi:MAG: mechanosensitive ion channel family protein [Mesorhizobium sp.]|nr:mechanosensitive ion channel family protein [Mesorhizobium sp.]